MNKTEYILAAREVLKCEANSIEKAIERLDDNFANAVETILNHKGKLYMGINCNSRITKSL